MTSPLTAVGEERLREILAGCEDVTPGPWCAGPQAHYDDDVELYTTEPFTDQIGTLICDGMNAEHDAKINAAHIARLDPNTVRAIVSELLALRPQREDAGAGGGVTKFRVGDRVKRTSGGEWMGMAEGDEGIVVEVLSTPNNWSQIRVEGFDGVYSDFRFVLATPQPSASAVWELEAAKHAHWEAFEGDSSGMVDDAERAKRNMRLWHAIEATLELYASPQPSAPEGWMLVPREPTEAMMQAGLYQSSADTEWSDVYSMWVDMWDVATGRSVEAVASPSPPTGRDATEEGWIEWHGGECPVEDATPVDFKRRNGVAVIGIYRADAFNWGRYDIPLPTDIIAYRLAAPKLETAQKGGKP